MSQAYDIKATLSICMQTEDKTGFASTLSTTSLHLNLLIDPLGFNILHDIANCIINEDLLLSFLQIFITQLTNRYTFQSQSILTEMVNTKTYKERRTPLLLAIQHNRFKLVKEFIRLGADPRIKDVMRHGPLHIAASMGRINIFVYFYSIGLSAEEEDASLRTPLHLSAMEGEELMSDIIMAWNRGLVNKTDENGQTPLHLATLAKNYKVTRHLLVNGAHRKIKDKDGKRPLQYAIDQENSELIKILVLSNQKQPSCLSKINPCRAPIKPVKNSYKLFILYILLFLARYLVVLLFLLPRMDMIFCFISLVLFITSAVSFMLASYKDPGFESTKTDYLELYEKYKPDYICPYCKCKKFKTTRHCHHCKRCVRKFDHHCPWIRNCIGENNKTVFLIFLALCTLDLAYHALLGVLDYLDMFEDKHVILPNIPTDRDDSGLCLAAFCGIGLIVIVPVVVVQFGNAMKGMTTYERFGFGVSDKDSRLVDTQSMLLGNESEWQGYRASKNEIFTGCCFKSQVKVVPAIGRINISSRAVGS